MKVRDEGEGERGVRVSRVRVREEGVGARGWYS